MSVAIRILVVSVALGIAACHVGPQIEALAAPLSPRGAYVDVKMRKGTPGEREYSGELLETTADGLLIGVDPGPDGEAVMTFIPWGKIYVAEATEMKSIRSRNTATGRAVDAAVEKFKLVSRFPQGLSPELRAALLASFGQSEVQVVGKEIEER